MRPYNKLSIAIIMKTWLKARKTDKLLRRPVGVMTEVWQNYRYCHA